MPRALPSRLKIHSAGAERVQTTVRLATVKAARSRLSSLALCWGEGVGMVERERVGEASYGKEPKQKILSCLLGKARSTFQKCLVKQDDQGSSLQ